MKKLIRRLSRVADSAHYSLLRSDSVRFGKRWRSRMRSGCSVPEGHLPVYVGEEMERFVVSAQLLNHPIFVKLLNKSAQEYGYGQKGALRIACHVLVFERVLEALRVGDQSIQELLGSLSDDFF
ncbi:auxin-responsive protein SAUR71-like [Diospyros lotus]|uniref:auxin-responsive protein SAUR71-like n=1 Tax=Diospyros lotus TaxID=55363 RepID=UPI0022553557|nr:auxin-responsive protein SAUR71-like [Diospyros lotus]